MMEMEACDTVMATRERRGVFAAHQNRRHEHTGGREEERGEEGRRRA